MTFRRRLGALATAVSGLLLAGLLLSAPAFAWSLRIDKNLQAVCAPDSDENVVTGTVILSKEDQPGHVVVEYRAGDSGDFTTADDRSFVAGQRLLDFKFTVPGPDSDDTKLTVKATAHFETSKETPSDTRTVDLEKCKTEESTTTTTTTVVAPTSTNQAPATTAAPPTTQASLGETPTTVLVGESLPRTGTNAAPLLIVALVLVVGGGGLLFAGRIRARHVK